MFAYDICSSSKCSMVYRGDQRDLDACPLCATARYSPKTGKALKQLYYLPVADWLKGLVKNKEVWE